ncbi:cbb3-type cytochrome oxidase assembly protein CcoS [Marinobacter arenosus]|uniref:cbb3-type cytochrome oxidase assembly protein CcoS n=1 Tax=Marinobacter arenosus TaxID=2856822 RepID=UPI001C4AD16C|nr:cbb3-type cytochrome oxidase assembly protein CcoS [Marinobacter arenosus]MBW0146572.1 cbb3-type cytochrome oxidase assembly protein CcoS [Marinobacter arenosus]
MQIVMILVPLVLIVVALGIFLFSWAVKSGQYDDLEGPAHRILYDDDKDMIPDDARTDKSNAPAAEESGERNGADSNEDDPKP